MDTVNHGSIAADTAIQPENGELFGIKQFLPEALTLGIREIDDQHQHLFELLAEIKEHCFEYGELPAEEAEGLLRHLAEHFSTEERIAFQQGCDVAQHIVTHQRIFAGIERGIAEVQHGNKDVFALLRYIEYWFERHIVDEDRPLLRTVSRLHRGDGSGSLSVGEALAYY
jgi:hemerythrin-like metal-binding protein